jgi:hypothetical protein
MSPEEITLEQQKADNEKQRLHNEQIRLENEQLELAMYAKSENVASAPKFFSAFTRDILIAVESFNGTDLLTISDNTRTSQQEYKQKGSGIKFSYGTTDYLRIELNMKQRLIGDSELKMNEVNLDFVYPFLTPDSPQGWSIYPYLKGGIGTRSFKMSELDETLEDESAIGFNFALGFTVSLDDTWEFSLSSEGSSAVREARQSTEDNPITLLDTFSSTMFTLGYRF